MRQVILKLISIIFIFISFSASQIRAGEVFRYRFEKGDSLDYRIIIKSDLTFPELGNLVQLVNLDRLTHEVELDVSLVAVSFIPGDKAVIKVVFSRISSVTVAGDSAYVDQRSDWGKIKTGSEYIVGVSDRGEIKYLGRSDSVRAGQVIQTMQRFFPVFPRESIELYHSWRDSVNFELEMPDQVPEEILSSMLYTYYGLSDGSGSAEFGFRAEGRSLEPGTIRLNGDGVIGFDNRQGKLLANDGDFVIDADVNLSVFGLPAALGTTRVHIESEIELELNGDE